MQVVMAANHGNQQNEKGLSTKWPEVVENNEAKYTNMNFKLPLNRRSKSNSLEAEIKRGSRQVTIEEGLEISVL